MNVVGPEKEQKATEVGISSTVIHNKAKHLIPAHIHMNTCRSVHAHTGLLQLLALIFLKLKLSATFRCGGLLR